MAYIALPQLQAPSVSTRDRRACGVVVFSLRAALSPGRGDDQKFDFAGERPIDSDPRPRRGPRCPCRPLLPREVREEGTCEGSFTSTPPAGRLAQTAVIEV